VHGDIDVMRAFAARLPPGQVEMPERHESFEL
jgi:hypothetical protein